jgi:hypothetical protein
MTELFGTTTTLSRETIAALYPGGHDDYIERFNAATRSAVDAGFLLAADSAEIEAIGAAAWTGGAPT